MDKWKVPVQSLIDHIKTATDVDPWAKDLAAEMLGRTKPMTAEIEGGGVSWFYVCPRCRGQINRDDAFCRHCGGAVSWRER